MNAVALLLIGIAGESFLVYALFHFAGESVSRAVRLGRPGALAGAGQRKLAFPVPANGGNAGAWNRYAYGTGVSASTAFISHS